MISLLGIALLFLFLLGAVAIVLIQNWDQQAKIRKALRAKGHIPLSISQNWQMGDRETRYFQVVYQDRDGFVHQTDCSYNRHLPDANRIHWERHPKLNQRPHTPSSLYMHKLRNELDAHLVDEVPRAKARELASVSTEGNNFEQEIVQLKVAKKSAAKSDRLEAEIDGLRHENQMLKEKIEQLTAEIARLNRQKSPA